MTDYFLSPNVYVAFRQGALIFLDLERDDYILVDGDAAAAFLALVSPEQSVDRSPASSAALAELLQGGLLTTDPSAGRSIELTKRQLAFKELIDSDDLLPARITPIDIWNFAVASSAAAWRLRFHHLRDIVSRVRQRKRMHSCNLQATNLSRARELTLKFRRLRHFFPRNYVCLYDSLALLEFLARYRVFPMWVFGVVLEPWGAHCWVQEEGVTFDEDLEVVANYTPVMAI